MNYTTREINYRKFYFTRNSQKKTIKFLHVVEIDWYFRVMFIHLRLCKRLRRWAMLRIRRHPNIALDHFPKKSVENHYKEQSF